MNLAEFLLARIAEEKALAVETVGDRDEGWDDDRDPWRLRTCWDRDYGAHLDTLDVTPERVLADCEAKRNIVEWCTEDLADAEDRASDQIGRSFNAGAAFLAHNVLVALATPYADHPDYRNEWRP